MDGSPLTRKVVYGRQTVIQGQGRFTKRGLPRVLPSLVGMIQFIGMIIPPINDLH